MPAKKLLSIIIPSNNLASYLEEALDSLLKEKSIGKYVEICISDNSNSAETYEMYKNKYSSSKIIKYKRSLKSPSLDENAFEVSKMANGKYIWFFGDDDLLIKDSLNKILNFLEDKNPSLVIFNSKSFDTNGQIQERRVPINENIFFKLEDNDKFLSMMGGYITYIPSILIDKNLWFKNYSQSKQGTFFAHVDAVLRSKNNCSAHFFSEPVINMRVHSQTWTDSHFEIWNFFYPQVIWSVEGYTDEAKEKIITKNPLGMVKRYISSRAWSRYNFSSWKKHVLPHHDLHIYTKLSSLFISLIPVFILKELYLAHIFLFRRTQTLYFCPNLARAQLRKRT